MNKPKIKWNCGWEKKEGRTICRWFIAYEELKGKMAGIVAGYAGGGAFVKEPFLAKPNKKGTLNYCLMDGSDKVTGKESNKSLMDITEASDYYLLNFADADAWCDSEQIIFKKTEDTPELAENGDMLTGGNTQEPWIVQVMEYAGITAAPVIKERK